MSRSELITDVKFTKAELKDFTGRCLDFTEIFCATPFYEYQREFGIAILIDIIDGRGNTLTGLFSRQSGKALHIDTPILTTDGWKTMGTVEVGDYVYAEDGTPTRVKWVSEEQHNRCYEFRFSHDLERIIADEDHSWWVVNNYQKAKGSQKLTTKELLETGITVSNSRGYRESKFRVYSGATVKSQTKSLRIDPYLFGYWLGDGASNEFSITVNDFDKDELLEHIKAAGYEIRFERECTSQKCTVPCWTIRIEIPSSTLRDLGVYNNKHIPSCYLEADPDQRKALLAGLLDSDGSIYNHNNPTPRVEFGQKREGLTEDVIQLARSLGQRVSYQKVMSTVEGVAKGWSHRCYWTPTFNPFRLKRKASIWRRPVTDRQNWLQITDINQVPAVPCKCIAVDHPSHVYLVGKSFIPTHNSETIANTAAAMMVLLPQLGNLKKDKSTYVFPQLRKFRRGLFVGIFTPSDNQSITTYKRAQGKLISKDAKIFFEDPDFAPAGQEKLHFIQNNNTYLELNNGSSLQMMSANKQANIESKSYHLILLDESQDLDQFVVDKSIMPMAAAYNGTSCATGTPGTTKGFFYNTIEFNKAEQLRPSMQQLHFQYDYHTVQKYNPDYKRYIDKQRRKIGEDSDEFRMAYRLHWLLERGMALSQELFDELTIKSRNITTSEVRSELVAGLDWGKSADSTVLTVGWPRWDEADESGRCPMDIIYWWEKMGDDYEQIFKELKDEVARFNIRTLSVDSTGTGEPLADRLIYELPHITIIPVRFTAQSKDHLYKNFLVMLQEKKCTWPGDSRVRKRNYFRMFEQQMLNLRKEYKNGYLRCAAPEDVKNAHDDFPDSLALCLWCIYEEAFPFVDVGNNNPLYQRDNRYHQQVPFTLR